MITFERNEKEVLIHIEHGLFGGDQHFQLKIEQSFPYQAELLKNQLKKNLENHLNKIKEEAYNEGWKAAKAKTKKKTQFFSWGFK